MSEQVKEILEGAKEKAASILPAPYSKKAKRNLIKQQGRYMQRHGKKISVKTLAGLLLETASLPE